MSGGEVLTGQFGDVSPYSDGDHITAVPGNIIGTTDYDVFKRNYQEF